ncbi:MAG: methyltransferase [Saprospiraceae bacterium]
MKFSRGGRAYDFRRYPATSNKSLQPLSAADELLLEAAAEDPAATVTIQHDRFGVLACCLHQRALRFVGTYSSQEKALKLNWAGNDLPAPLPAAYDVLSTPPPAELVLTRLPKSLELLEVYLAQVTQGAANPPERMVIGFMTRHFSPRLLEIAGRYAENVEQSKARKKARTLHLSGWKATATVPQVTQVKYGEHELSHYPGVFASGRIDPATRFLLEELKVWPHELRLLDPACGNGIIGLELLRRQPTALLTATDDFSPAAASARLNLPAWQTTVLCQDDLAGIPDGSIHLAACNPPFHFEYETNIEVSIGLFRETARVLRPGGRFVLVANRHLNYATHLEWIFPRVRTVKEQGKFVIYECTK